jgi:hypothetical protein
MTVRRPLVLAAILTLAAAESLFWLLAGLLRIALADFFTDPNSPVIAERIRLGYLLIAWSVVNALACGLFATRRSRRNRQLMIGIQAANLVICMWNGIGSVSAACWNSGFEWFWPSAAATLDLLLLYALWARFERGESAGSRWSKVVRVLPIRSGVVSLVLIAVGISLTAYGWRLGSNGIELHSGTVSAVQAASGGSNLILDSYSRPIYFSSYDLALPPSVHTGDHVAVLTADSASCGYGSPMAIEVSGVTTRDPIYGGDVNGYTPDTWWLHEAIRWLSLIAGIGIAAAGFAGVLRWIG